MKIRWLGHSSFLLTASDGTRVVTDPYDDTIGYRLPYPEADIVTISHGHFDHNYTKGVKGPFTLVDRSGRHNVRGIGIHGVPSWHDDVRGGKRGQNIIFIFMIDGLAICHCGDLGHQPDASMVREIGRVDVLMVPAGGTFTVDGAGAAKVAAALKPSVTIPMHYKTKDLSFSIDNVDKFLAASGIHDFRSVSAGRNEIEITQESLTGMPSVVVLDY